MNHKIFRHDKKENKEIVDFNACGKNFLNIKGNGLSFNKLLFIVYIIVLFLAFFIPYYHLSSKKNVSTKIDISIAEVEKISKLGVLSITDTQVIAENPEDNTEGITAWTQFTGRADFMVNLQQSEFVVDNARKTIIVRTPNVTIDQSTFALEYGNTEIYLFHNSYGNDSYREGVNIAQAQIQEAYTRIFDNITRNPHYYTAAKKSAESIIESLIKSWNKNISDLNVLVEVGAI